MVVADAGPLIVFARIGRLNLLRDVFEHHGREAAQGLGISVIGSLAVLATAKRVGLVDRVSPILGAMIAARYWIDHDLIQGFLAEVGEGERKA